MGWQWGIVGLPNVGKSTLFNALSNAKALVANFPFCTIAPNVGVIPVPDERLIHIANLVQPQKVTPATIEIIDIAGLVAGASKGEGLGNQFLAHIRQTAAIIHVIRCFDNPNIAHVNGEINPIRDKEIVDTELLLKDLETIARHISKYEKSAKAGGKDAKQMLAFLEKLQSLLSAGKPARMLTLSPEEKKIMSGLYLLTSKPVLYVCNVDEASVTSGNAYVAAFQETVKEEQAEVILISAALEAEIAQLEHYEDRTAFLQAMGLQEAGINRLIRSAYRLLDLITFFTQKTKEVRAWTIPQGFTALQAAGIIHSDFQRGFIRAEVISYADFIRYGSEQAVKEAGKIRIEGKEYLIQDGDIILFRFNI